MEMTYSAEQSSFFKNLSMGDWLFAALLALGAAVGFYRYGPYMDVYEQGFLAGAVLIFSILGWRWKPIRLLMTGIAVLSLFGISQYHADLARGTQAFFLKFLFSSQSAIMWMNVMFVLAMLTYWVALFSRSEFVGKVATAFTWSAVTMGFTGLMVRWYESYLIAPDVGHIPISNLYEVFVLFCLITALLYLFYESRFATRQLGGFVLVVVNAAVGFILWYTFDRQADGIQPLVPALQSYWMKIHVPANFIGYGSFSFAAMTGVAWLLARPDPVSSKTLKVFQCFMVLFFVIGFLILGFTEWHFLWKWVFWMASLVMFIGVMQGKMRTFLPAVEVLDDLMYKVIAIGFAFFTIATILGAMWAAEAWGGYWSWDPKETWALIVWLNYAAWLHLRLVKGLRGPMLAWWALVGLIVTTFAFLGVNMFLSGLHSYGQL